MERHRFASARQGGAAAEGEVNEAADYLYLNRESTGLGEVFLDDIQHATRVERLPVAAVCESGYGWASSTVKVDGASSKE